MLASLSVAWDAVSRLPGISHVRTKPLVLPFFLCPFGAFVLPAHPTSPNTLTCIFVSCWSTVLPVKPFCLSVGNIPHSFWVSLRSFFWVSSSLWPLLYFYFHIILKWGGEHTACSLWCDLLASDFISKKEDYFALSVFPFPDLSCIQSRSCLPYPCLLWWQSLPWVNRCSHACNGIQHSCWGGKKLVLGKIWISLCVFQRQTALEMLMFFFNNQKKQNQYIYQCKRTLCFAMLLACKWHL